jgi:outer membrane protein assembly factor BamA
MSINFDQYAIQDSSRFQNNPIIFLQFRDVLGSGLLFRDLTYIYNKPKNRAGNSLVFINNLEFSGLEVFVANKLINLINGSNEEWKLNYGADKSISFAKYIKYELDFRFYREFSKTSSLAFRFNTGAALPYGDIKVVPFIKQFGLGGPNSMRAWNIRQVGPGSYADPLIKIREVPDLNIYIQQGDIKLETNLEYRFKIFLIFDGALFVDVGNVWNLRPDPLLRGAELNGNFLNSLAVGAGYGIRLNFGFFNIRFDAGYKVRSPYRDAFLQRNWYSWQEISAQGLGNIQVAVNYPF